jgi:GT2 family glycosyltransferase
VLRRRRLKRRPFLNDLPRRGYLTIKHHGWGTFAYRLVTFPLRLVGLERGLRARQAERAEIRKARHWYSEHCRPVTIVIPTYGPPGTTIECARAVVRSVDPGRVRVVVVDDGTPAEQRLGLERMKGVELVLSERNAGYAASVNRGLELADEGGDLVVLNSDVAPHRGWLEVLQRAAYESHDIGIVGPRLLYPSTRIQSAGSYRNLRAREWFDHRYRGKPRRHGPARVPVPVVAVTGACMYVKRELIEVVGAMDDSYRMGYEDVDWCLRAWEAGFRVEYEPGAVLTHLEAETRGTEQGERELESQARFWRRWRPWFDGRETGGSNGGLRIIYVTEGTGVGGGHRVCFEHLNRLADRGHKVELYTLDSGPDWFSLQVPIRTFPDYDALISELGRQDAIKVATWWRTAAPVWLASLRRGVPVYFVQDIETSYHGDDEPTQNRVLASYREEFRYLTTSQWVRERLGELRLDATAIPPGVDFETYRALSSIRRSEDVLLAVGRSHPLKNFPLTLEAWKRVEPRPPLWLYGIAPELAPDGARYFEAPSDERVNELMNEAAVFVQTSRHEGFCLPLLEAMAAGAPVVCTDAHGNRDYCVDGENCLLVDDQPEAVAAGIDRLLRDPGLRERLSQGGRRTAEGYGWSRLIDELESFFERVAAEAGTARAPRRSGAPLY